MPFGLTNALAVFQHMMNNCKDCRAEANVKTKNRENECAGLMGAWSHAQYAGERKREREKTENSIPRKTLTQYTSIYMCVCSMHTFIQVLTRTDRSTIVLQCS